MPFASLVGVLGVLALVLGLLVLTLRGLRRLMPGASGQGTLALEVLARLPLGPRQGIAVVRIGGRKVAVSVGEGGVHTLLELDQDEPLPTVAPAASTPVAASSFAPLAAGFAGQFRKAIHGAIGVLVIAMVLGSAAHAQATPAQASPARATPVVTKAAAKASASAPAKASVKGATKAKVAAKVAGKVVGKGSSKAKPRAATVATTAHTTSLAVARIDTALTKLAPRIDLTVGDAGQGGLRLSGTVGVVVMMGMLTLLPMLVLMMTGFTRILIVLSFLRQAIGAQNAPPTQLVAGLALLLTGFIMAPTLEQAHKTALEPWMNGKLEQAAMLSEGVKPFRTFMLHQVRESDLASFMSMSRQPRPEKADDVPLVVLASAFVTSELRTAFQIGFALFLPFIVIDVVVASVLMSMGMMMVPPAMIALPFKLLLFVMVDGWTLVIHGLVQGFHA